MSVSSWGSSSYGRQEPIAYIRGYGLDLTSILVIVQVIAAVAAALAFAAGYRETCYHLFLFDTKTFWAGYFWTPFTDPFFHDLAAENIWFAVSLFFFWRFGREMEFYLGRRSYTLLYALLVLVPVVAVLISSAIIGAPTGVRLLGGGAPAQYAMFISFCIVYPSVMFFFIIEARWLALISVLLGIAVILAVPYLPALVPLLACLATAYFYLNYCGANRIWDPFEWIIDWKQNREVHKFEERKKLYLVEEEDFNETMNTILDKIAREGIQSLTLQEKQNLEKARAELLRREKRKLR